MYITNACSFHPLSTPAVFLKPPGKHVFSSGLCLWQMRGWYLPSLWVCVWNGQCEAWYRNMSWMSGTCAFVHVCVCMLFAMEEMHCSLDTLCGCGNEIAILWVKTQQFLLSASLSLPLSLSASYLQILHLWTEKSFDIISSRFHWQTRLKCTLIELTPCH